MKETLRVGNFAIAESDGQVKCDVCKEWESAEYVLFGDYQMCPSCIEKFAMFMGALSGMNEIKNKIK